MKNNYTDNRILELFKEASDSLAPSGESFDALLLKLDASKVAAPLPKRSLPSPLIVWRSAGAFAVFIFVLLGARSLGTPLQEVSTLQEGGSSVTVTELAMLGEGEANTVRTTQDTVPSKASESSTAIPASASFAKSAAPSPEAAAIESATSKSLAAEKNADSDLFAISDTN